VRVIAGSAKGHNLKSFKGFTIRPTLDRVREAVFNVIGSAIIDSSFLDLFAGTGAVGIEALSRGAKICYFNEKNKKAVQLIQDNIMHCRLVDNAKIFNMDALNLIPYLQKEEPDLRFDLIYLDPPYKDGLYEPVVKMLQNSSLISRKTLIIMETGYRIILSDRFDDLELIKKNRYGDTTIWYYKIT